MNQVAQVLKQNEELSQAIANIGRVVRDTQTQTLTHRNTNSLAEVTPRTAGLTSYAKGRPIGTDSKVSSPNDFKACRQLVHERMPKFQVSSFQRVISVINFKADSVKVLARVYILTSEQVIEEFEKISSIVTGQGTKLAVMIANAPVDVQEHVLLNYGDKKASEDVRGYMLNVDKTSWTKLATGKRQTITELSEAGQDHVGQADMDINQVKGKAKEKG